jgi:hypothetical protein
MISKYVIHHLLHLIVKAFLIRQVQYVITVGFQVKKTDCGPACPYSIYDNEIGYGRPWIKYTWTTECVRIIDPESRPPEAYCYLKKIGQSWYSLGDNAEPGCPNCGSRKTGYLASGQCDPTVSGGFYKVCCKPDGTVGVNNVYAGDTVNPPYESVCTVGQGTFLSSVPQLGIYQPPEAQILQNQIQASHIQPVKLV